ncbi:DUF6461 domain-containing protein [Actinokineospora spheciospongiae]|uniref:DUF6461 domain-containing protein n=1 Tax=Actinokineospora spheciospongiae TaxID=909613 RepID=UPI0012692BB1|nr:DUF6461 domain-containing protein [Actinokineospora spheciospongiae]
MTGAQALADWNWLGPLLDFGGCLTFAKGASRERVLRAFDLDPATAVDWTLRQALREHGLPGLHVPPFWVRVAELGGWTMAAEVSQAKGYLDQIELDLAREHDVVTMFFFETTPPVLKLTGPGGALVTTTLGEGHDTREGTDPHHLDPALDAAGVLDFAAPLPYGKAFSRAAAAVAAQLGIALDAEAFTGPLPTASRNHPYTFAPGPHDRAGKP